MGNATIQFRDFLQEYLARQTRQSPTWRLHSRGDINLFLAKLQLKLGPHTCMESMYHGFDTFGQLRLNNGHVVLYQESDRTPDQLTLGFELIPNEIIVHHDPNPVKNYALLTNRPKVIIPSNREEPVSYERDGHLEELVNLDHTQSGVLFYAHGAECLYADGKFKVFREHLAIVPDERLMPELTEEQAQQAENFLDELPRFQLERRLKKELYNPLAKEYGTVRSIPITKGTSPVFSFEIASKRTGLIERVSALLGKLFDKDFSVFPDQTPCGYRFEVIL